MILEHCATARVGMDNFVSGHHTTRRRAKRAVKSFSRQFRTLAPLEPVQFSYTTLRTKPRKSVNRWRDVDWDDSKTFVPLGHHGTWVGEWE